MPDVEMKPDVRLSLVHVGTFRESVAKGIRDCVLAALHPVVRGRRHPGGLRVADGKRRSDFEMFPPSDGTKGIVELRVGFPVPACEGEQYPRGDPRPKAQPIALSQCRADLNRGGLDGGLGEAEGSHFP